MSQAFLRRTLTSFIGLLFLSVVVVSGCGGSEGDGLVIRVANSGGTTVKNPGRTSVPFTGGTSSGGTDNSGGTNSAGSGSSTCPICPAGKVLPLVGAQIFGPDPGPCSAIQKISNETQGFTTYVYTDDGHLLSEVDSNGDTNYTLDYDDLGRPILLTSGSTVGTTIEYGAGYIRTNPIVGVKQRYELDALGYPRTDLEINVRDGSVRGTMTFVYENCRMVSMYFTKTDGTIDPTRGFTEITYDDKGHIRTRSNANTGRAEIYDYSCW